MPTKRPRVAAYLSESLYERFKQFASERKLGDSQALIRVLSDYFGVDHQVAHGELPQVLERVERLESSLSTMRSDLLDELKRSVLAELAPQAVLVAIPPSEIEKTPIEDWARRLAQEQNILSSEVLISPAEQADAVDSKVVDVLPLPDGELHGDIESESIGIDDTPSSFPSVVTSSVADEVPENLPSGIEIDEICLSRIILQKRLGTISSTMSRNARLSDEAFAVWSSEKDPDKIPWKVNSDGTVSPAREIPLEIRKILIPKAIQGMSHGDLAKRFKIDPSTLSHLKKGKSPEELLKATREKDPDGIGWLFNPEIGRYVEDPGSSPRMTQSELPGIVSPESDEF